MTTTAPLLATQKQQRQWMKLLQSRLPRVAPRCRHVGDCGGCHLQEFSYENQLRLKQQLLLRAFEPFGLADISVVPLEDPWRYRNKLELSFGRAREAASLGLHRVGSFWDIVDLQECWLAPAPMEAVIATVREAVRRSGVPVYDVKRHEGFWRHAIVRYSRHTQQLLLCLITADGPRAAVEQVCAAARAAHAQVASCYWGINRRLSDVAVPDTLELLSGEAYLREQIGPFVMDLHPMNFVQPSLTQAERIYEAMAMWLSERGVARAWDLYAGIGCIGFYLSRSAQDVLCFESDPRNVELLQHNAALNNVRNITAHLGAVESSLRYATGLTPPEAIVVDPPRAGLHKYALRALALLQPRYLIYLSCNLSSLLPNLQTLLAQSPAYQIRVVRGYDMFPQTHHVETLVILERQ